MFRDIIPHLADRFHLVAPDLPGFGQSDMPARSAFTYTFENIANVIDRFAEVIGLVGGSFCVASSVVVGSAWIQAAANRVQIDRPSMRRLSRRAFRQR